MLNKLSEFIRRCALISPGDRVVCAVSGGADSVALLFALYLLRERLDITLEAAHFNHRLRGEESDADEAFVKEFCDRYNIPLHLGSGEILPGKKGLEAAAREARYAFLRSLPGKIATAHTADDNAETVLLHLVRGTGLKGLGGIAPVNGKVIRPMLTVTRREVEAFLEEYALPHREDSTNATDLFLRNRIRRKVMPLLIQENPSLAETMSAMALGLREDEEYLSQMAGQRLPPVQTLREMHPALRARALERFLKENGVPEPEKRHIALAEQLVFSDKPSARADFPGGVTIARRYDTLEVLGEAQPLSERVLEGSLELKELGLRVVCAEAEGIVNTLDTFTVVPKGKIVIRSRLPGDAIRLSGGTKSLKKLFIDRKIPAHQRNQIPVVCDEAGILGVYGIGADQSRIPKALPAVTIRFEKMEDC
ncbi:MAG: tRNA lysidine(34) synthetase TilS [Faecousia sp.]